MSLCEVTAHAQWSQNIVLNSGSLIWAPTHDVPGFKCCAMTGLLKKTILDLPIGLKGNSKHISGNSLIDSVEGPEQGYRRCFVDVTDRG